MGEQTRKCLIKDLPRDVVPEISRFISSGDRILACYETQINVDWGKTKRYYAHVITQERIIIFARVGFGGQTGEGELHSMRLAELSEEVAIEQSAGRWYFIWNSEFVTKETAREFSDILRQAIRQAKTAPQQPNLLNELERLAALHRNGALTDLEFQNAKRKLGI